MLDGIYVDFSYYVSTVRAFRGRGRNSTASQVCGHRFQSSRDLFYALASGLAKIVSDSTSVQTQVQPYSGTSTFLPMMDSGELDLGVVNAVDMGLAYQGSKRFRSAAETRFRTRPMLV